MNYTSVLKKIGQIILTGSQIATQVMGFPFIAQILGAASAKIQSGVATATSEFGNIAGIISLVETMFPGTGNGSQKLAAATPAIQQALLLWAQSNLPGHNKVKDPVLLAKAAGEITGGFADFMNSLGD